MVSSQIWLELTEDFGGESFGPIDLPEYRLGTAEGSHVRLAEGLGIEPHHVRVVRKSGDTFYLAPVERHAIVWLHREGAEPQRLHGPTVIRPGDAFSLASPQGVRFRLVRREQDARSAGGPPRPGDDRMGTMKRGLISEVVRRMRAGVLSTSWGGMADQAWRFVRQGQFLSPIYLVGGLTMLSGWGLGAWSCRQQDMLQIQLSGTTQQLDDCATELDIRRTGGVADPSRIDLAELVARIHRDPSWKTALAWPPMQEAMKAELAALFAAPTRYEGWYLGPRNPHRTVTEQLIKRNVLPTGAAQILAWAAVEPLIAPLSPTDGVLWDVQVVGDATTRSCLRGPLRLSYRQAIALGLDAQEDAWFDAVRTAAQKGRSVEDVRREVQEGFQATRYSAGLTLERSAALEGADVLSAGTRQSGRCFAHAGRDERDDLGATMRALATAIGPTASGLPAQGADGWISARVARLYAMHLTGGAGGSLNLAHRAIQTGFAASAATDPVGVDVVAQRTGQHLARATALPCLTALASPDAWPDHLGEPPDFDACALLKARVEYDRL